MKSRVLFWTGTSASALPLKDVLWFLEFSEEIFEERMDLMKQAVAEGVAEVLEELEL